MLKAAITIILLLLLEGVKRLIIWVPDPSDYFYFNLCSCLQVFLAGLHTGTGYPSAAEEIYQKAIAALGNPSGIY